MDLYDVMRTTFAAREFTGEPLPDRTLYRVLDNARFAPSGGNRQAVRIIVVGDQQIRDHLAELSVPGAQRYVAQLGIGEAPWNPLGPSSVPAAGDGLLTCGSHPRRHSTQGSAIVGDRAPDHRRQHCQRCGGGPRQQPVRHRVDLRTPGS